MRKSKIILTSLLILLLLVSTSFAAQIILYWRPPVEGGKVEGYRVYYKNQGEQYSYYLDVEKTLYISLTGLVEGEYLFTIAAYNEFGEGPIEVELKCFLQKEKPERFFLLE